MDDATWERWAAASGYLVIALGIAGAAFERGAPAASAPATEILAFVNQYRVELLAQSLFFVLSAGVYLWFFACLRTFLRRAEGGSGTVSGVAFGAGVVWISAQLGVQAAQVAGVIASGRGESTAVVVATDLAYAASVVAYVPLAMMLIAVAVVALRDAAFPAWVGWLSTAIAIGNLAMAAGIAVPMTLLVPGGALTYVLYALLPVWLLAVTTVVVRRIGQTLPRRPGDLVA